MISQIKSLAYRAIARSGLPRLMHKRFNQGQLSVLMYHGVTEQDPDFPDWCFINVERFQAQMNYLKQHFNVVSLTEAERQLREGTISGPTAVITFDDGYKNNHDCAYPILRKANIPATIFLTTNLIDTDSTIWTGLLSNAFAKTKINNLPWRGKRYDLSSMAHKQTSLATIKRQLKNEPYTQFNQDVEAILSTLSGNEHIRIENDSPYTMLDTDTIRAMAKDPLIEFGAHTHNHPILSNLSAEEQVKEISRSIEQVELITEKPCDFFAYPNGELRDYNDSTIAIMKNSTIKAALTTIEGTCNNATPAMEWRRFGIGADMDSANFQLYIHNFLSQLKPDDKRNNKTASK